MPCLYYCIRTIHRRLAEIPESALVYDFFGVPIILSTAWTDTSRIQRRYFIFVRYSMDENKVGSVQFTFIFHYGGEG